MSGRLSGKVALVTGAASGIGAATAALFAEHGATVIGLDRNAPAAADARLALVQGDITDGEGVQALVADILARHGRLDVLVNNAGADVFSDPLQLTDADWQRCLDLNLKGAWNLCKAALPAMVAAGAGSIVNIASVHGHKIIPHAFPYPVAKHGLIGMTKALGIEYAAHGVRVNSISPGLILVPRIEAWFAREPGARERQTALLPPGRIGTPQEVAYTALFLASDEARFINATDILIDGGRSQLYHE
ncbi:SDR family oxidoreductase [Pseudoxanthomonas winnipegensis]|jgi:NAD(P)-dependent dehydrogenase (short-subunit alcohol dehydrogenase family)|uniref:SDR family oxidoreductase n=1 Tax=Pseudoxanthomonas winnipegensis TaxID=2480810 RepID=A0ABY1WBK2_9GAMM|nr:SDR family oxidoreductase [Pseudoxanthomonas winnipegensis]TAA10967.1 SDR family oxidoreductase [Pseudoxanthomonas winnipegensis]TAA18393.1 SDR family oxidoreductase [Pseudoxanthomonas winnipegensis]TAH74231.1 SDR family oxidoreductase [Pseudoxanthomonas winnipegensis]WJI16951.1 SDR family oxidoreductase [Pseudoxanthomonas winnipegensis]